MKREATMYSYRSVRDSSTNLHLNPKLCDVKLHKNVIAKRIANLSAVRRSVNTNNIRNVMKCYKNEANCILKDRK